MLLVLPENMFNIENSTWFRFELNLAKFPWFLWKNPCKEKKACINYFDKQEKPWIFFKNIPEKENFKAICTILDYSKPKILFVGQPFWPRIFLNLVFPTILVLVWPWPSIELWDTPKSISCCVLYLLPMFIVV